MSAASQGEASDDDLVAQGLAGSEAALVELYRRFRPRILRYVWRMSGDRDLAEEIFCATFAALFENLPRYQPCGRFAGYLFRIAHNQLIKERVARERLRTPLLSGTPYQEPLLASERLTPDESLAAAEQTDRVRQAIAELPEHLREIVILRLYEGMDYLAIGGIVGLSAATARSRMRYALQTLRRSLGTIAEGQ